MRQEIKVAEENMIATSPQLANLRFDRDGFVLDPEAWSEDAARSIAADDGLGYLNEAHMQVLRALRAHYMEHGALMPANHICRVSIDNTDCIYELFGNMREAWRVAGLPNPGEEAKNYMASR